MSVLGAGCGVAADSGSDVDSEVVGSDSEGMRAESDSDGLRAESDSELVGADSEIVVVTSPLVSSGFVVAFGDLRGKKEKKINKLCINKN